MNSRFQNDDRSLYEVFLSYDNASGSSIVCTQNFDIVEIRTIEDVQNNFYSVSTISLCFFVFLAFFYKKVLETVKHLIISVLKGWFN